MDNAGFRALVLTLAGAAIASVVAGYAYVALALLALSTVTGAVVQRRVELALASRVEEVGRAMGALARGDRGFDERLEVDGPEALADLAAAFNGMVESLHHTTMSIDHVNEIIESMTDTLIVLDLEGRVTQANRSALDLLGVEAGQLTGRPLKQILGDPWLQYRFVSGETDPAQLRGVETSYLHADGTEIPVSVSVAALGGRDGEVRGYVCLARDIRDRKRAEMVLRDSEARFRDFAECASDWFWETDAEHRFTYLSQRFADATGVPIEYFMGRRRQDFISATFNTEAVRAHIADLAAQRAFRGFVYPVPRDDDVIWVQTSGTPIFDARGRFVGYRGTGADVTAIEHAKHELIRARDVSETAARSKSEFLANVSHEFRTPMNGVLGMLELLSDTVLEERQREFVDVARRSASSLQMLLDDVLELSTIDAGRLEFDCLDFDPARVVEDLVAASVGAAAARGLRLEAEIRGSSPPRVRGDAHRLRRVLDNLVSNAIKFTESGGVVLTLATEPTQQDEPARLRFSVSDTGIGIAPDALATIFDTFTQADGSASRRFGGTGLGLALCRQLVERMGGTLGVESEPDRGSVFEFVLAFEPAMENATAVGAAGGSPSPGDSSAADESESPASRARVLVVEDNAVNQKVVVGMLAHLGHEALVAGHGGEAIEVLEREPVDLVLMDCQMPVVDGYEATQRIRASASRWAAVPIVALTANAFQSDAERCFAAGMNDYLSKPMRREALAGTLERWLSTPRAAERCEPVPALLPPPAAAGSSIDCGVLEQLREVLGDSISDVVEVYLEDAPMLIDSLRRAADEEDTETVVRITHALKSSSGNLGACRLSDLCRELEIEGRSERIDDLAARVSAIVSEFDRVSTDLGNVRAA